MLKFNEINEVRSLIHTVEDMDEKGLRSGNWTLVITNTIKDMLERLEDLEEDLPEKVRSKALVIISDLKDIKNGGEMKPRFLQDTKYTLLDLLDRLKPVGPPPTYFEDN